MTTRPLKLGSRQLNENGSRRLIVADNHDFGIVWLDLIPYQGIIFAEAIDTDDRIRPRLRYAALQLAIQSLIVTSSVTGQPVACAPTSRTLRKMLLRAGWVVREDPALLVREPGAAFTRPLPSGYRPKPPPPAQAPVAPPVTTKLSVPKRRRKKGKRK